MRNPVKCAEWEPEITTENELFKSLVPDDALIAASNYTEKTDQLWRDISDEIESKNIELKKCKEGLEASGISTGGLEIRFRVFRRYVGFQKEFV